MSFLCGLIDMDGCFAQNKIEYATSSPLMVDDLRLYCPVYGIYPCISTVEPEKYTSSGYKPSSTMYKVTFSSHEFWEYSDFIQHDIKRKKIEEDKVKRSHLFYDLTIPDDRVEEEEELLWGKENKSWGNKTTDKEVYDERYHFRSKLKKDGCTAANVYNRNNKSYQHLLHYDRVVGINSNLKIDETFKDITVEDNNCYYTGNGSYFVSHNCGFKITPDAISKIPPVKYAKITRDDVKDADFIVPDSREGWIKLLGKVMKAHFYSGKGFTYSCMLLRSKGALIKNFGGVAGLR